MKYIKFYKKLLIILVSLTFILIIVLNNFLKSGDDLSIFQNCTYEKIENIPQNSIIVIGHAYGSPLNATKEDYLPNKVTKFLSQNKDKIETLILTGDIFWQPSKKKWDKLFLDYNNYFNIHIAPGNHDIDSENKKKIFQNSNFRSDIFYKIKDFKNNFYFIENSIVSNWHLNPFMINQMKNLPKNSFTIFRHNIAVRELVLFANSKALMSKTLPSVKNLQKKVDELKSLTIISGDGGAFKELPRLTCLSFKNIKFIINGIGDIDDDKIIIISENKLFSYNLK